MKVKICGVKTAEDAMMCERLGADAIGVVHYPGRGRSVPLDEVSNIFSSLGPFVTRVVVTEPSSVDQALHIMNSTHADVLQSYTLDSTTISSLQENGVRVIRGVKPERREAEEYGRIADAVVFERGVPGKGERYDYSSIPVECCRRAIIAGGLTPENVVKTKGLSPYGVDVSSGVERSFGRKDASLVEQFIRRCKS